MEKKKTVYILGAGASASAKLPTQIGLLPRVFSIDRGSFHIDDESKDFLSLNINNTEQRIQEFYPKFDKYRRELGDFIVTNFSTHEEAQLYSVAINQADEILETSADAIERKDSFLKKAYGIAKSINVTLEDLFTIFDSVDSGREHFRLYSPNKMMDIHNKLKMCIIYALSFSIATDCDTYDYDQFSKMLLKLRMESPQKSDPFSVISMNWDDILEQSLFSACDKYNSTLSKNQQRIYPDLCFYNYDLADSSGHIPSTQIKARGHKNIKVLKMHGSLAWLECPKCGRIYTDFANEIASEEFDDIHCPICKAQNEVVQGDNPILRSLIITPTFLKSLGNLNLKNIWHNAYLDISKADHLVFIGYSFPDADFEMRCLLKKAVKNNADITVVLTQANNPEYYIADFTKRGYSINEAQRLVGIMRLPAERYNSFFGEDRITYYYDGFREYLKEEAKLI